MALGIASMLPGCGGQKKAFDPASEGADVYVFTLEFDEALQNAWIDPDQRRAALARQTVSLVERRLCASGTDRFLIRSSNETGFELAVPPGDGRVDRDMMDLLGTRGLLEFRIEVRPSSAYGVHPHHPAPSRARLWGGTDEEFEAFRASEIALWRKAREAERPYVPTDDRLRLVWDGRAFGLDRNRGFHLVEEPAKPFRFGNDLVDQARVIRDSATGQFAVVLDVPESRQAAFAEWTEANIGMPLAIIVDGEFKSAPILLTSLRSALQITLGTGEASEMRGRADRLARALAAGPLPVRPMLTEFRTEKPTSAGSPK